jgi:protease I
VSHPLADRTVAFVVADQGVEQVELTHPRQALAAAGVRTVQLAPQPGHVQAYDHLERADRFRVEQVTADAQAADYDAIVLPGGVANHDILRRDKATHRLLQQADARGTLLAAICHGLWTLIDADGNRLTAQSDQDVEAFTELLLDQLSRSERA